MGYRNKFLEIYKKFRAHHPLPWATALKNGKNYLELGIARPKTTQYSPAIPLWAISHLAGILAQTGRESIPLIAFLSSLASFEIRFTLTLRNSQEHGQWDVAC